MRVCGAALVTLAAILLSAETGRACTCAGTPTVAQARDQSAALFSGSVVKVKRVKPGGGPERVGWFNVEVVFAVTRSWKGVDQPTISVFTHSQSSACGYGFRSGRSYLVYAQLVEGGRLATGLCGRTRRLKDAREDLKELGGGKAPIGMSVSGKKPHDGMHPTRDTHHFIYSNRAIGRRMHAGARCSPATRVKSVSS